MQISTTDKKSLLAEHFLLRHLPETALDRIVLKRWFTRCTIPFFAKAIVRIR